MSGDYRDVVIRELADSEGALLDRVASLEADVAAYRMLAQQTIHALHHVTVQHQRLTQQQRRLRDDYRAALEQARRIAA